jgi:excinuclease UvrABC nuclease subunit
VYRLYDANGALLYVGRTKDIVSRIRAHRQATPWWAEVDAMKTDVFPTPEEAASAEREQVRSLSPLYNKHFNPGNRNTQRKVKVEDDASRLRILRAEKGWSIRETAERAAVSPNTVQS